MSTIEPPQQRQSSARPAGVAGPFDDTTAKPACDECVYWKRRDEGVATKGYCRRYAPPPVLTSSAVAESKNDWPLTRANDWCGEYRPRINAAVKQPASTITD